MSSEQISETNIISDKECRNWAMILHFSLLAGYIVPLAGLVAPIIIWQIKKDELPGIDAHGKVVVNWLISAFIYAVIFTALIIVIIGIPLLIALGLLSIIYPIIGGVKANEGKLWKYPLTFQILK